MEEKQEEVLDLEAIRKQTELYQHAAAQGGGKTTAGYCKDALYWAFAGSFGYQYAMLPANSIVNTCVSWGWIAKETMTSNGLFWVVNGLSLTLFVATARGYQPIVKKFIGSILSGNLKRPETKGEVVWLIAGGYTVAVKALVSTNGTYFNNADIFSKTVRPDIPAAIFTAISGGGSLGCHGSLLLGKSVKSDENTENPIIEYHLKDVYETMPEIADFLLKNTHASNEIVVGRGERWFGNVLTGGDAILSAIFYGNGAASMFITWGLIDPDVKFRMWQFYLAFFSAMGPIVPVNFLGKQQYAEKFTHRLLSGDNSLSKKEKVKKCCGQLVGAGSGAKKVAFNVVGLVGAFIKFLASFTSFLQLGFGVSDRPWARGIVWVLALGLAFCTLYMTISVNNHQEKQTARMPFWSHTKDEELAVFKEQSAAETYPLIEVIEDDEEFQEKENSGMGYQGGENPYAV